MTFSSLLQAMRADLRARRVDARERVRKSQNDAARAVEGELYATARRVFDRPTPWIVPTGRAGLGAVRLVFAGRNTPDAVVQIRGPGQVPGGAIPQQSPLRAEIKGGQRRLKRLELALQRVGAMPSGWLAIPAGAAVGRNGGGGGARLDAYGNMSRGQVVQLIAYFQGFGAANKRANMTDERRRKLRERRPTKRSGLRVPALEVLPVDRRAGFQGVEYFSIQGPGAGLPPGIWERRRSALGSTVRPVLFFVRAARYPVRLDFYGIAARTARDAFALSMQRRGSFR